MRLPPIARDVTRFVRICETVRSYLQQAPRRVNSACTNSDLGNIVGGFVFTGLAIYLTYKPRPAPEVSPMPKPTQVPAE
jgi:hypothetical protein